MQTDKPLSSQLSDNLCKSKIDQMLQDIGVVIDTVVLQEVDSTNIYAKKMVKDKVNGPVLVLAEAQTNGRGRMGRSFYSPNGSGLYMSYAYKVTDNVADSVVVTALTAVAVVTAIEELTDKKPKIKWVNDIYIDNKKICGILAEAVTGKQTDIIIGIGINVTTKSFPDEIKDIASSISVNIDRNLLAVTVIKHLTVLLEKIKDRAFIEKYREKSLVLGKTVEFKKDGKVIEGRAVDIDNNGGLIVEAKGSITVLNTGEISLKLSKPD